MKTSPGHPPSVLQFDVENVIEEMQIIAKWRSTYMQKGQYIRKGRIACSMFIFALMLYPAAKGRHASIHPQTATPTPEPYVQVTKVTLEPDPYTRPRTPGLQQSSPKFCSGGKRLLNRRQ